MNDDDQLDDLKGLAEEDDELDPASVDGLLDEDDGAGVAIPGLPEEDPDALDLGIEDNYDDDEEI
jgi:hypothetical protein